MPKVSIVLPAYNGMAYLPTAYQSALMQTFTDYEILIVNDGSSDRIEDWVAEITEPRVRYISQKNQGAAAARNTGIYNARGNYVAFLDADDIWEPTKLEKQVSLLEKNPEVGLVDTWITLIDRDGNSKGWIHASSAEGQIWSEIIQEPTIICGSSPMIRRECFENVGVFDPSLRYAGDWDLWIRIASRYSFAVVKEPLVRYRLHPQNTSKNCRGMARDCRTVIDRAFASATPELMSLKDKTFGQLNSYIAGIALDRGNYQEAMYFRSVAIAYNPKLRFSKQDLRLNAAIALLRWFGLRGYDRIRNLTRVLRQKKAEGSPKGLASASRQRAEGIVTPTI
jgi:glycosyltransferase involved in cell wall biosynthesis